MTTEDQTDRHILEFDRDGVTVKEVRRAPFSDEQREIEIESLDWGSFPEEGVTLDVVGGESMLTNDGELDSIKLKVSRLGRPSAIQDGKKERAAGFWKDVEQEIGIRKRANGTIALNGDMNAKENLVQFVEYLFWNDRITKEDFPIKSGWKWNLINNEPKHQNGDKMYQEVKIYDGVWLETKYSREDIKDKILTLGEEYGGG